MERGTHGAGKELVVVVDCLEEATLEHLSTVTLPTFACQVALQVLVAGMFAVCPNMRSGGHRCVAIWPLSSPNHGAAPLFLRTHAIRIEVTGGS